jgi:ComF family protein
MRTWLRTYKFLGEQRLAPAFAHMLLPVARELIFRHHVHHPVLTYVPISTSRGRERGFNQAQLLTAELARQLRLPDQTLLIRPDESAQHSMHNRQSRLSSSAQFQLPTSIPNLPAPCDAILIVDDVYTTGGTLAACASALKSVYSAPIFCLTWARS